MGESVARAAFQENFPGEAFEKDRRTIGMELDGFSEKQCLAFEYDGLQHRVEVAHFQRNEGDHAAQRSRDEEKDFRCMMEGITLLRIPDRLILPINRVRGRVRECIMELGYDVPAELPDDRTFYAGVRAQRGESPYLAKAAQLATAAGGLLLSDRCPTRTWPVQVRCRAGHEFETHFDNLVRGRWCPQCATNAPKKRSELEDAVTLRGYQLLDSENRKDRRGRSRRYITVQCPNPAHAPSEMIWDNFQKGRGCLQCGTAQRGRQRRLSAEEAADRLAKVGLRAVDAYSGMSKALVLECMRAGHRFTSSLKKAEMSGPSANCPACAITAIEGVRMVGAYGPETNPTKTQLDFVCTACEEPFRTTYRGLMIRKKYCRNPQCE
jgi:hypothetical protein